MARILALEPRTWPVLCLKIAWKIHGRWSKLWVDPRHGRRAQLHCLLKLLIHVRYTFWNVSCAILIHRPGERVCVWSCDFYFPMAGGLNPRIDPFPGAALDRQIAQIVAKTRKYVFFVADWWISLIDETPVRIVGRVAQLKACSLNPGHAAKSRHRMQILILILIEL